LDNINYPINRITDERDLMKTSISILPQKIKYANTKISGTVEGTIPFVHFTKIPMIKFMKEFGYQIKSKKKGGKRWFKAR
jgi:hypothetical protein